MNGYIAIFSKDADSIWGVHFPDLPGCTSAGSSMGEAVANASKALRLWAEDEAELPLATPLDDLRKRPDVQEDFASGGTAIYVPLIVVTGNRRLSAAP